MELIIIILVVILIWSFFADRKYYSDSEKYKQKVIEENDIHTENIKKLFSFVNQVKLNEVIGLKYELSDGPNTNKDGHAYGINHMKVTEKDALKQFNRFCFNGITGYGTLGRGLGDYLCIQEIWIEKNGKLKPNSKKSVSREDFDLPY